MKRVFSAVVLVSSIVAAVGLVGGGAYLGSTFLILLGLVGVPAGLVGMVVLHYLSIAQRAGGLGEVAVRMFDTAIDRWTRELDETLAAARKAGVPDPEIESLVESVRATLAPQVDVVVEDGKPRLVKGRATPGGNWIHRVGQGLRKAYADAAERVVPSLEERLAHLRSELKPGPTAAAPPLPRTSLLETSRAYLARLEAESGAIASEIEATERAISDVEAQGLDMAEAWNHLRAAKRLWAEGQADLAMNALRDAESIVHRYLEPEFLSRRQALLDAVADVQGMDLKSVGSPQLADSFLRLIKETASLALQTGGLGGVEKAESRFAELLARLTKEARERAERDRVAVAAGLTDPESLQGLVDALKAVPAIGHPYQETFPTWLDAMRPSLARLAHFNELADWAKILPRIEQKIREKLQSSGRVTPADLPIRDRGAEFLAWYAGKHNKDVVFQDGVLRPKERGHVAA